MTEILAPAGSLESAYTAIVSGADAIYLGLTSFSARSSAENFDMEGLQSLLGYAHAFGVRVHVAMNTLIKQNELSSFLDTAVQVWNCGVDAIIIQDIFVGKYLKQCYPDMVLHLSTQAGVCNEYGARLAKRFGFDRVILARETKLEDIAKITQIIETEVFVQGALCTCFSGQCYLSSFAGGNSGNRGKCKQPCRKRYFIDRKGFEEPSYAISLSDLSVGEDIQKLKEIGVTSFKIEGRMRRPEYVAAAVSYYGKLLYPEKFSQSTAVYYRQLKRMYNRGNYTKGLGFGQDKTFLSANVQGHIGEFVGIVKVGNGKFLCESKEHFESGDGFKILRDGKEVGGAFYGGNFKNGFILNSKIRLKNGDKVFITTDVSVVNELSVAQTIFDKVIAVPLKARFVEGECPVIEIGGLTITGDSPLQPAQNRALTQKDIFDNFNKRDKYPFQPQWEEVELGNVFLPSSSLNALRRKAYASYFEMLATKGRKAYTVNHTVPIVKSAQNTKTAVVATRGVECDILIYKPEDYAADIFPPQGAKECYLFLPPYLSGQDITAILPKIQKFDGIYCDGFYGLELALQMGKPLFAGTGFNLSNTVALSQCNAAYVALSKELTVAECKPLLGQNTFYLSAGDIKVMDLIYCPFGKSCNTCDKRTLYTLTDDEGRKFPLRRYQIKECRFELYNCAKLVIEGVPTGLLFDCSLQENSAEVVKNYENASALKKIFGDFTKGHGSSPVF